jgi:hypothetical protein
MRITYHCHSFIKFHVTPSGEEGIRETLRFTTVSYLRQSVGFLGRGISPSQGRYLYRTIQTQNKLKQTSLRCVGFEPTIPVFERTKTVHALDHAVTVIGKISLQGP